MYENTANKQPQIVEAIIKKKLARQNQLLDAESEARIAGRPFFDVLLEKGMVDQENLAKTVAEAYNLPSINLVDEKIGDSILKMIPVEVAENYKIICFNRGFDDFGGRMKVGIVDPGNFNAFEAIDFLARKEEMAVEYYVISPASFNSAFKQYKSLKKEISVALEKKYKDSEEKLVKVDESEETEEVIKSAPVAKMVSVIIKHAIDGGASDIHIEPLREECRVRYRIDGILHTSLTLPKALHNSIVSRIKVLASLKIDETRVPQDGRIRMIADGREYDFRVSVLPLVNNEEKVVMRILDTGRGAPTLEGLGFAGMGLKIIQRNVRNTTGMLLVTGPTGSGKSTTLFSVLNILNEEKVNISTLEDPVEYYVKGVNQSQIRPEIGFTFASGLRSLLRQDPNVIMVGEIRDSETAELAIHSALTGHFVLSTLHTNSAIGALPRLIDMKAEPFLLASTLNTVIAQRLARKICAFCRVEDKIPAEVQAEIIAEVKKIPGKDSLKDINLEKPKFYKGEGCPKCGKSGFAGRVAVYEIIDNNDKMKDLIVNKKLITLEDILSTQPFATMKQDGYLKVLKGITSVNEVMRVLQD